VGECYVLGIMFAESLLGQLITGWSRGIAETPNGVYQIYTQRATPNGAKTQLLIYTNNIY
jgi:hypothetical protein